MQANQNTATDAEAERRLLAYWDENSRDLKSADDVCDLVGDTPIVRLNRVLPDNPGVEIYGKLEAFNPGGSVKDRAVSRMIGDAKADGRIKDGTTLLDSTSGNTGIAYAILGAAHRIPVELVMPGNVSRERVSIIKAFGAKVHYSDPMAGSDGAIVMSQELMAERGNDYVKLDQYNNPSNWQAHYDTTGKEIWEQTEGRVTHLVSALGTTGTCIGTGRRLKEFSPGVRTVAVQPDDGFHGIEGLKHLPSSLVPGIYDDTVPDETIFVDTECAYEMTRRLSREEGLMCGQSSGAALCAAFQIAQSLEDAVIVCIFCDCGDRYLSTGMWEWNRS